MSRTHSASPQGRTTVTSFCVWCMGGSSCRGLPGAPSLLPAFTCAGASKPFHSSAHSSRHLSEGHLLFAGHGSWHQGGEGSASPSFSLEVGNRYWPDDPADGYLVKDGEMCS